MSKQNETRFAVVLTVQLAEESNPADVIVEGTTYTSTLVAAKLERDRIINEFKNQIVSIEAGKPARIYRAI